jgi:hypothetical protein
MRVFREILWCSGVDLARLAIVGGCLQFLAWITDRSDEIIGWVKNNELWFFKLLIVSYVLSVISDMMRNRLVKDATTKANKRLRR